MTGRTVVMVKVEEGSTEGVLILAPSSSHAGPLLSVVPLV